MRKVDLAYIAGVFDGEGSVALRFTEKTGGIHVCLDNTAQWLPEWLYFSFGGRLYARRTYSKTSPSNIWRWRLTGGEAMEFLRLILPYLRIKRPHAEVAIQFESMQRPDIHYGRGNPKPIVIKEAQDILRQKLKTLNRLPSAKC